MARLSRLSRKPPLQGRDIAGWVISEGRILVTSGVRIFLPHEGGTTGTSLSSSLTGRAFLLAMASGCNSRPRRRRPAERLSRQTRLVGGLACRPTANTEAWRQH